MADPCLEQYARLLVETCLDRRDTLFDEKMDGNVHLALGNGFPSLGGTNASTIHRDIVEDLRQGGRILLDGRVVQEHGAWRI